MTVSQYFSNKMAVKTVFFWFSLLLAVIGSNAEGELTILHTPNSLRFEGISKVKETALKELFSAALGLSTEQHEEWDGLYILNPFKTPEAAVEVYVDGVSHLDFIGKAHTYKMEVDEYEPDTFDFVKQRIRMRYNGESKLVNLRLSDPYEIQSYSDVFGRIEVLKVPQMSLKHLKTSVEEDLQFLNELEALKAVTSAVRNLKPDNKIDYFYFRFTSLHPLSDFHGSSSLQTKEAKTLLKSVLMELRNAFVHAYDGSVLVTAVATDVAHTRRTARAVTDRAIGVSEEKEKEETAKLYTSDDMDDADYPAIFNIILWFCVVMVFALVSIVYTVMDMDPGRDSIIYRMTSTRMKKDN